MKKTKINVILAVSGLFFVVAVISAIIIVHNTAASRELLLRKQKNITQIKKYAMDLSRYTMAQDAYNNIPGTSPVKFNSIFSPANGIPEENIRNNDIVMNNGWKLLRREVVMDNGKISDVIKLIRQAETQRPPWKLAAITIKSAENPGYGRIVMQFEALKQLDMDND